MLFKLMYEHVISPHLTSPVKTRIISKSLNEVCKQTTFRNVKLDNDNRENTAIGLYIFLFEEMLSLAEFIS